MKKTGGFTKFLSLLLLCVLAVTSVPLSLAAGEGVQYGYLVIHNATTNRVVNFRPVIGSSDYIDQLPEYWVVQILGERTRKDELWYEVRAKVTFQTSSARTGFIKADFVQKMTEAEQAAYLANPTDKFSPTSPATAAPAVTPTPEPGVPTAVPTVIPAPTGNVAVGKNGYINTDKVFFRKQAKQSADAWALLPYAWGLTVLENTNPDWYKVKGSVPSNPSHTYTGYVMKKFLSPAADAAPEDPQSAYGAITVNGVSIRDTIGGTSLAVLMAGEVVNVITAPAGSGADDWYYVELNGVYGYVQATVLRRLKMSELSAYTLPAAPASTAAPATSVPAPAGDAYIKLILGGVNIRKTPGGTILTPTNDKRLPKDLVLAYTDGPVRASGYDWVMIAYKELTGYVRSDCFIYCDKDGKPIAAPATPTPAPTSATAVPSGESYITLSKGGVNVREKPWGKSFAQLAKGTTLRYWRTEVNVSDNTLWYYVYVPSAAKYGYVLSTMAFTSDAGGKPAAPGAVPDPGATVPPASVGYVASLKSSVYVRNAPAADAGVVGKVAAKMTVLRTTGAPVVNGVYTWYPIEMSDGTRGYIRGDCVFELAEWQYAYYKNNGVCPTPTPGPATPRPGNSDYVITTDSSLWIRKTPSKVAETLGKIMSSGTILKFSKAQKVNSVTWYQITSGGVTGWIHGGFARVMTNAEYDAYQKTLPTPTPKPAPTALPDPATLSDLALTSIDRVKIRADASMKAKELTMVYQQGTELQYLKQFVAATATNPYNWFKVKYAGVTGWMNGDFVRVLTEDEKRVYGYTGDPDSPREATYRTLSLSAVGDDVKALQQRLADKGYLSAGEVTGTYLTSTEQAVSRFQKDHGLTMDGIAGEKTQHMLFGTVPAGTYTEGSVEAVLYPVEMIDWYTGGIQSIWKVGVNAIVVDVYTGIAFRAQRLYGDAHADCEPATKDDTDAVCRIYKVSNAQEISDREKELQSWRRRPLWVTIGTRTFCASMYGIPHNFSGDRIPDNNYNGQFCIHFTNSRTHESNVVDTDRPANGNFGHQSAIKYAYEHTESGKK